MHALIIGDQLQREQLAARRAIEHQAKPRLADARAELERRIFAAVLARQHGRQRRRLRALGRGQAVGIEHGERIARPSRSQDRPEERAVRHPQPDVERSRVPGRRRIQRQRVAGDGS